MEGARPEQMADIGVSWAVRQAEGLLEAGVPCLHFYVTTNAQLVAKVVERLLFYQIPFHRPKLYH
jgi:methylenetetrahydrofolate reductase (NADPH)